MKLVSWNVNGIRAVLKKELFFPFIEELKPDVICLQETKAHPEQVELELPGYEQFWNSAQRKGYSGTAIFTKVNPEAVFRDFPEEIVDKYELEDEYGDTNAEGRVLVLEFEKFFVATVYTPNSKGDLTRLPMRELNWDRAWLEYMQLLESRKPVLFSGDLNVAHTEIDLAQPKRNVRNHGFTIEERGGFSNLVEAGFVDTFRHYNPELKEVYSWWSNFAQSRSRNVGWRIDYWLVSQALIGKVTNPQVHMDIMGSDHCPVSIDFKP